MAPDLATRCWAPRRICPSITNPRTSSRRKVLSFFFVFDVAADDLGDVGVLFFLLFDKGLVFVVALDLLAGIDVVASIDFGFSSRRLLGARRFGVGLFKRNRLDLLRLGRLRHCAAGS